MTENALIAAVSNEGRMLVFPIADLPELARGKGNKIINIPGSRLQSREEFVIDYGLFPRAAPWWCIRVNAIW